jgi:hypothetical protein
MTTTADRREEILERLAAILSGLTITLSAANAAQGLPTTLPAGNFVLNRNELPSGKVPGIILCDGDEINDPRMVRKARGQTETGIPPQLIKMTPEIYVVLDERKPNNVNVGADLNLARLAIIAAIFPDQTLQAIVGNNGDIIYEAGITDLARNRAMQGQLGISISFSYPLLPSEYVGR